MLRAASLVLVTGSLACTGSSPPPFPLTEVGPRAPWADLERRCARGDDPPHIERRFVGEDRHEQLLVPVGIEPVQGLSQSWFALGEIDPDLHPLQWSWLIAEVDEPEASRMMTVGVQLVSRNALDLTVAPMSMTTRSMVIHALLERLPSGELVGTLEGGTFSGIPPFEGRWDDLSGALRISTPAWHAPARAVVVHLELSSATLAACGQLQVEVPPQGQLRRMQIPTALTHPSEQH